MPKNPNAPKPEQTYSLFQTDEPFKAMALRLGVSPNTLRKWWVEKFGQEAFEARGKAIQAKAAAETGRASAGKPRTLSEVKESCEVCKASVALNVVQRARLSRIVCQTCQDKERGADHFCPVCGLGFIGQKGLSGHLARPQNGDVEAHRAYLVAQEAARWEGKQQDIDYVVCLVCGERGERIDRHLQAEHGLTVEAYRFRFTGASVWSKALRELRSEQIRQSHQDVPRKGQTREVACSSCGVARTVGLTFAPPTHETRCFDCVETERFASKVEGADYVVCQACGHKTASLVSHIRSAHSELEGRYTEVYPDALVVALNNAIRDKMYLRGRTISDDTKAKMSANAGRWNAGLTKDTDERVAGQAAKMTGRTTWSKGLTKADHPSLQATSEKLSRIKGPLRTWSNGLKADLSEVDFTPYLDETGAVDRRLMAEELDLSEPTITKYMEAVGLRLSTKYIDARAERQIVRIEKAALEPFKLANGKVVVAHAMVALKHDFKIIKRECERQGLETFHHRVRQTICLDTVSKSLGGVPYEQEWRARRFTNPPTGHMFRFDGYFPSHSLIVEFHGYQHWTFPSVYIKDEGLFRALQERDRIKEALIRADSDLRYFLIREDEPYADVDYVRGRLLDEGVLER